YFSYSTPSYRILSYFLTVSIHHIDLHSFPTRRSSDLAKLKPNSVSSISLSATRDQRQPRSSIHRWRSLSNSGMKNVAASGRALRSEEHTSELQSRVDLVCRLLLEKKNTIWHE